MEPTKDTDPGNANVEKAATEPVDATSEDDTPVNAPKDKQNSPNTNSKTKADSMPRDPNDDSTESNNWPPSDLADGQEDAWDEIEISSEVDDDQVLAMLNSEDESEPAESPPPDSETTSETAKQKAAEPASGKSQDDPVDMTGAQGASESATEEDVEPAIDSQTVLATLAEQRTLIVDTLFGTERPMQTKATQTVSAYVEALQAAANAEILPDNALKQVAADVAKRHAEALAAEKSAFEEGTASTNGEIARYNAIFIELEVLIKIASEELESRQSDGEAYQNAPEELQSRLSNYRKGIEIILRMFNKVKDRKKDLSDQAGVVLTEDFRPTPPPDEWEGATLWIGQLLGEFHGIRDANYHAVRDAKKLVESYRSASCNVVKSLLSAIDGIDSGQQNEPSTLEALAKFREENQVLIEAWFGAYDRVAESVEQFLEKTGVQALTVKPGTPFDPESMEPLGIVEVDPETHPDFDPKMEGEFVAAVLRRGFSLGSELIRPVQVDVVNL